jgi:hypothetical protein
MSAVPSYGLVTLPGRAPRVSASATIAASSRTAAIVTMS